MTRYYYEKFVGREGSVYAENDEQAMNKLREMFGDELKPIMILYVEKSRDDFRTVWSALTVE